MKLKNSHYPIKTNCGRLAEKASQIENATNCTEIAAVLLCIADELQGLRHEISALREIQEEKASHEYYNEIPKIMPWPTPGQEGK